MGGKSKIDVQNVHLCVHHDAEPGRHCVRHLGREVKEVGWDVSMALRGGAGIEKRVHRFGIHKHSETVSSAGPPVTTEAKSRWRRGLGPSLGRVKCSEI